MAEESIPQQAIESIKNYAAAKLAAVTNGQKLGEVIRNNTASMLGLSSVVNNIAPQLKNVDNANSELADSIIKANTAAIMFGLSVDENVHALGGFSERSGSAAKSVQSMVQDIMAQLPSLGKFGKELGALGADLKLAKGFESEWLYASRMGGNFLNTIQQDTNNFGQALGDSTAKAIEGAAATAGALGISLGESINMSVDILKKIPGAFDKMYSDISIGGKPAMRSAQEIIGFTSRALGIETSKLTDITSNMLGTFNKDTKEAMTRVSLMASATKDLGIPFGEIEGLAGRLDESFAMWGDQMGDTLGVLGQVSGALQNSGVGFKQQIALTEQLTKSFIGMSLGQKAFLGVQAGLGGAGGAVGAGLQVELMMQEGKMGDLVGMLQQTIEQRSGVGRALTLQDAVDSPQLQQAFQTQRGLLETFGISGEANQNRLLEAMSKSNLGEGAGKDAEQVLSETLTQGHDLASKQTEYSLNQLNVQRDMLSALRAMTTYEASRDLFTAKSGLQNTEAGKTLSDLNSMEGDTFAERDRKSLGELSDSATLKFDSAALRALSDTKSVVNIFTDEKDAAEDLTKVQKQISDIEAKQSDKSLSAKDSAKLQDQLKELREHASILNSYASGEIDKGEFMDQIKKSGYAYSAAEFLDNFRKQREEVVGQPKEKDEQVKSTGLPTPKDMGAGSNMPIQRFELSPMTVNFDPIDINVRFDIVNGTETTTINARKLTELNAAQNK